MPELAKRTGISFTDESVFERAKEHAKKEGHRNFSAYVEWLIKQDLESGVNPRLVRLIKEEVARQTTPSKSASRAKNQP